MIQSSDVSRVGESMSTEALNLTANAPLKEVAQILVDRGLSGAAVVDAEGRALGVVSQTDLLRHFLKHGNLQGTAEDAMTALAVSLPADATMAQAASVMAKERIHRAVVHNTSGHVIGMLTSSDVVRWVAQHEAHSSSDESA